MAMTTSPGPGVGSGNSRSSSFRLPRKTMPFISVSFAFVDERQERLPRAEPPEVLAERRDDAAGPSRRAARGVRRDDHARVGPERVTRRQGLGVRDVEARAPEPSLLECDEEVVAVHDRAARDVDEGRARTHAAEQVTGEEVVGRLGERERDDDGVQAVGLPDRLDAGLGGHVLDVHRQHAHPESERAPRHGAPRAAEADDAHRQLVELALLAADRLAQAIVGRAERGVEATREAEEEREGVLGQVDADLTLLGRQDDVALDQVGGQDRVHPGADGVVVAQAPLEGEDLRRHATEQHVRVHDLGALARRIGRFHEGGAGAGRLEDPGAIVGGERRDDQNGCIKDPHVGVKSSSKGAPVATKIVLSPKLPGPLVEIARAIMPAGYELRVAEQGTPEFLDAVEDAEYFVGFARTSLGSDFYRAAPHIKLVQLISAGYDRVDIEAARKARIPVCNNGGANAIAVAEHTLALMLAVTKKLVWQHNNVVAGKWRVGDFATTRLWELSGKTLGIVGLGNIGKKVARRALGFDMHVQYYDVVRLAEDAEDALGVRFVLFQELVRTSDVVSLHVPLTDRTRRMMGEREVRLMQPGATLINTCRGPVVDEPALHKALTTGKLAGAGLDVMLEEPPPANHPLFSLDTVTITPHMAGPTWDNWQRCFRNAFDNIQRVAAGGQPLWVIR